MLLGHAIGEKACAEKMAKKNGTVARMLITDPSKIEKLRTLGMGSFGRVFLARPAGGDTVFALKSLQKGSVVEMQQQKNVILERAVMAECQHPFIVELVASYQDATRLYMGMPVVRGGEVAHRLADAVDEDDEPLGLPAAQGVFYTAAVAVGCAHIHSKGFLWRDLKPENVMISANGYPKLVDFGLSKRLDIAGGKKAYTMCGTPEYIAPEIVKGSGHGPGADWYALGCFLFECLSGWTPYVRDDEYGLSIYRYVVKKPVEIPDGMSPDSPEWELLSAMLEKDPAKRIGCLKGGVQDILDHKFMQSTVDVEAVCEGRAKAPWVPVPVEDPTDFSHLKPDEDYGDDEDEYEYEDDGSFADWDAQETEE